MRIAVVTWSSRKVGGIETYLDTVLPLLAAAGNHVALWHETDRPVDRTPISVPDDGPHWCVNEIGSTEALKQLREWRPDLIYAHGLLDSKLESAIPHIAPSVFFAHQYHGTCISGGKTWKSPRVIPCHRQFGLRCLVHYYPHRCGGWHPLTMTRMFRSQARRLAALRAYGAIVTHTEHMRHEYLKHGFPSARVHKIPFPVKNQAGQPRRNNSAARNPSLPSKLLFLGRMDRLKGGSVLVEAVQKAAASLRRPLSLTFAGDGPERSNWEQTATSMQDRHSDVSFSFVGWVKETDLPQLFAETDLLVLPSLWPEPFGMVGLEAGFFSVPSVAFDVGGITEWLSDGINGHVAPGDPPSADGLAAAIVKCFGEENVHRRLSDGALAATKRFSPPKHIESLLQLFRKTVRA